MSCVGATVAGEPDFDTATSAWVFTVVVAVALSLPGFGSGVGVDTVAVSDSTVPLATLGSTFTTSWNVAPPRSTVPPEQVTVPLAPTAGVEQLKPGGVESD